MAGFFDDAISSGEIGGPISNEAATERMKRRQAESTLRVLLDNAGYEAVEEAFTAASKWPPMNSAHEAFGVLAEEVDELTDAAGLEAVILPLRKLWDHVKVNQKRRDPVAMRAEAIQVAAMALRFAVDIIDGDRVRK